MSESLISKILHLCNPYSCEFLAKLEDKEPYVEYEDD